MCCFSGKVDAVTKTNIFARNTGGAWQAIVYSMSIRMKEDVAMILPIPVAAKAGETGLRFINLEKYPDFFVDISRLFQFKGGRGSGGESRAMGSKLEVVKVGSFDASFVPTVKDFSRLDERFRLPDNTWNALPQYKSYGFAVFKLRKGASDVHPMAFEFARADPSRLFFPTVHIHDGKVHATATFDHILYCQKMAADRFSPMDWMESAELASKKIDIAKTKGVVMPGYHVYRKEMAGKFKNDDVWLA